MAESILPEEVQEQIKEEKSILNSGEHHEGMPLDNGELNLKESCGEVGLDGGADGKDSLVKTASTDTKKRKNKNKKKRRNAADFKQDSSSPLGNPKSQEISLDKESDVVSASEGSILSAVVENLEEKVEVFVEEKVEEIIEQKVVEEEVEEKIVQEESGKEAVQNFGFDYEFYSEKFKVLAKSEANLGENGLTQQDSQDFENKWTEESSHDSTDGFKMPAVPNPSLDNVETTEYHTNEEGAEFGQDTKDFLNDPPLWKENHPTFVSNALSTVDEVLETASNKIQVLLEREEISAEDNTDDVSLFGFREGNAEAKNSVSMNNLYNGEEDHDSQHFQTPSELNQGVNLGSSVSGYLDYNNNTVPVEQAAEKISPEAEERQIETQTSEGFIPNEEIETAKIRYSEDEVGVESIPQNVELDSEYLEELQVPSQPAVNLELLPQHDSQDFENKCNEESSHQDSTEGFKIPIVPYPSLDNFEASEEEKNGENKDESTLGQDANDFLTDRTVWKEDTPNHANNNEPKVDEVLEVVLDKSLESPAENNAIELPNIGSFEDNNETKTSLTNLHNGSEDLEHDSYPIPIHGETAQETNLNPLPEYLEYNGVTFKLEQASEETREKLRERIHSQEQFPTETQVFEEFFPADEIETSNETRMNLEDQFLSDSKKPTGFFKRLGSYFKCHTPTPKDRERLPASLDDKINSLIRNSIPPNSENYWDNRKVLEGVRTSGFNLDGFPENDLLLDPPPRETLDKLDGLKKKRLSLQRNKLQ